MAASLANLFDGAQTSDGTSASQNVTAGDYVLAVQGTAGGCRVIIEGNVFDSNWDAVDGLLVDKGNTGFSAFRMCEGSVRAKVVNAGSNTSVKVGIFPAQ